jgi:O-antigen/teichoic acid export membrane protein
MFDLETRKSTLEGRAGDGMKTRLSALLRSVGMKQSLITGISMISAGVFDYGVNVVAGRWLEPIEYGIFISVTAILQALLLPAIAIRVVVAFYTVELSTGSDSSSRVGAFLRRVWRWAWQWGLVAAILLVIISPPLARSLRLPNSWPLWAASLMVLMLFLRESTYGALQGTQAFTGLGLAQVLQALLRLLFAAGLIMLGWRATGAILAQPLGCIVALALALWWLRPHFEDSSKIAAPPVSWSYSARTLLGLGVFGVLTNLDALFVKHFFSPQIAGDYGPVVTLAKVSLFLPWAIGIVLLPKVMKRQAEGRDARPILLLALMGALAPGLAVTTVYLLSPGMLVKTLFSGAYANPGLVLGLASLAATFYAGLYIWLNYALSIERPAFVYALIGVLAWQGLGMYLFGRDSLVHMTMVMVSASLIGNLAGFVTTWSPITKPRMVGAEVAGQ